MQGLLAPRKAVLEAVVAIDRDMRLLARSSQACQRLMTNPGVGQLTALAFVATIDAPERFRRSRDVGAYLGLVPRRFQSGEINYVGSISKCGDRRVRTLLYEAAKVLPRRAGSQRVGAGDCPALDDEEGPCGARPPVGDHHACHAPARHHVPSSLRGGAGTGRDELPSGALPEGGCGRRRRFCRMRPERRADCGFNQVAPP
jgi:Transposase IS116/IS110/IS902 family